MARSAEDVLNVVGLLHEGLADDAVWMPALDALGDLIGSQHFYLASVGRGDAPAHLVGHHTAPAAVDLLKGPLANQVDNPWVRAAIGQPLRRPLSIADIGGQTALERTRVWRELYVPYGVADALGIVLERQPERADILIALRRHGSTPFDDDGRKALALIAPHVARAWRVKRMLADWAEQVRTLSTVLDRLDRAVILTDEIGTIRFANEAADRLLSAGDGIDATNGRLRTARPRETDALRAAIGRAAATAIGAGLSATDAVSLPRTKSDIPLAIVAEPLAPAHGATLGQSSHAGALLFIGDSEAASRPSAERLRVVYGLTRSEARLTSLIVEGHPLSKAAAMLEVSGNTAKFHLKAVFGKVGVNRQADLVRRVLADVGGLAEPAALRLR